MFEPVEPFVGPAFAAAVAWYLVRFLTRLVKDFKNTIDNHIEHNTEALVELTSYLRRHDGES